MAWEKFQNLPFPICSSIHSYKSTLRVMSFFLRGFVNVGNLSTSLGCGHRLIFMRFSRIETYLYDLYDNSAAET